MNAKPKKPLDRDQPASVNQSARTPSVSAQPTHPLHAQVNTALWKTRLRLRLPSIGLLVHLDLCRVGYEYPNIGSFLGDLASHADVLAIQVLYFIFRENGRIRDHNDDASLVWSFAEVHNRPAI